MVFYTHVVLHRSSRTVVRFEVFTMNFPHVRKRIALKKERLVFQRILVDSENWVVYYTGILKCVENISQIYFF